MGAPGGFARWSDLIASLWNTPYGRSLEEIGRMTLSQICVVYRGWDKDGALRVSTMPDESSDDPKTMYVEFLKANGIYDRAKQERLYGEWQSKQPRPG